MTFPSEVQASPSIASRSLPWFAIWTKSKQENRVTAILSNKNFDVFYPVYRVHRRWSDRTVQTELPLFPGYVFCRLDVLKRLPVLTTPGVVGILGSSTEPVPVADHEIEAVQAILRSGQRPEPCPFIREGQRIRVIDGSLEGQQGILLKKKNECRLIVSVTMLQRSVSVEIDHHSIEAL